MKIEVGKRYRGAVVSGYVTEPVTEVFPAGARCSRADLHGAEGHVHHQHGWDPIADLREEFTDAPAKPAVPRVATSFADLTFEAPLTQDGPALLLDGTGREFRADNLSFWNAKPVGVPVTVSAGGLRYSATANVRADISHTCQWHIGPCRYPENRWPQPKPACHPKCTVGAPCRRDGCKNAVEHDHVTLKLDNAAHNYGPRLDHETERRAKWLAEARALEDARRLHTSLPVVRPWAQLRERVGGWDRRGGR